MKRYGKYTGSMDRVWRRCAVCVLMGCSLLGCRTSRQTEVRTSEDKAFGQTFVSEQTDGRRTSTAVAEETGRDSSHVESDDRGAVFITRDSAGRPVVLRWHRRVTGDSRSGADRSARTRRDSEELSTAAVARTSQTSISQKAETDTKTVKADPAPLWRLLLTVGGAAVIVILLKAYLAAKFIKNII